MSEHVGLSRTVSEHYLTINYYCSITYETYVMITCFS